MATGKVLLRDVTVRFRLSYDRTTSISGKLREIGKRVFRGQHPRYHEALREISLTIHDGDIVGIIGPNGSGKSTLLRTISGIYFPDSGTVNTFGKVSTLLSLGTGFDNRLTGIDNIRMNGLILGLPKKELEEKIPAIEEFAEIGDYMHVPMKYYSSGMISRVSFSIVLAMQPDILLIDEVFSVGDLQFQRKSARALHELLNKAACQVIVTHNLDFVRKHCTRAIYLRSGRIVAGGEPQGVVSKYEADSSDRPLTGT
jgi:ABC-type polysaccharide/polyol phosphate transport system ATPase subunit